jgi:DNA polymerase-3 subunit gamma/tau
MQMSIGSRPRRFDDIFGQPSVVKEMNSRKVGHNWPQAILLKGMTGTGKTTTAQIIAMSINCKMPQPNGDPCCGCPSCKSIIEERFDRDTHMLDGGSSSKDEVIDFASMADLSPMYDKNAIFIIEEADQLSPAAKNSLLKLLERPKSNVYFILLSMVNTGISTALQSRCQSFTFRPFSAKDIMLGLRKVLVDASLWGSEDIPKEFFLTGLSAIAESASGSFRSAIQMLEKCITGEYWTPELIRANLGIIDVSSAYESLDKLLNLDATFFLDMDSLDMTEFFNITYATLTQAAAYKFTKTCTNEYFEAKTQAIASNRNLFDLLKVYDDLQSYTYLKKALVVSKFVQYFAAKKLRRIEE